MYCNLKVEINSNTIYLKAIIDSGNFLKEPITKIPVIVVERNSLKDIIPDYILNNLDRIINGEEIDLKKFTPKIRVIPFTSLGKENGLLLGIKADKVIVELEENIVNINNVIIGIYNGILSKNDKYKALIGLDLLEIEGGSIENEYIRNIKV